MKRISILLIPIFTVFSLFSNVSAEKINDDHDVLLKTVSSNTASRNNVGNYFQYERGKYYWYENGVRQGTYSDSKCVMGDGTCRGREIYDPQSNGRYWLDSAYDGAKAEGKEVWIPYIYQNERSFTPNQIESAVYDSNTYTESGVTSNMGEQVRDAINGRKGKWVRYDANGKMAKGWYTVEGAEVAVYPDQVGNTYYYDWKTGLMAKGWTNIGGVNYYFNETTGVLESQNNNNNNNNSNNNSDNNIGGGNNYSPTLEEKNALDTAKRYLNVLSFSRDGLIDQLKYEGYSESACIYAVDNCGADWYDQALKSAKNYLEVLSFSKEGLYNQLTSEYGAQFTSDQARYAVDNCGADWNEQAAKTAQNYLDVMSFSRDGLYRQLEYEKFTPEQIEYGLSAVGY